jgi:hypothetical protein
LSQSSPLTRCSFHSPFIRVLLLLQSTHNRVSTSSSVLPVLSSIVAFQHVPIRRPHRHPLFHCKHLRRPSLLMYTTLPPALLLNEFEQRSFLHTPHPHHALSDAHWPRSTAMIVTTMMKPCTLRASSLLSVHLQLEERHTIYREDNTTRSTFARGVGRECSASVRTPPGGLGLPAVNRFYFWLSVSRVLCSCAVRFSFTILR